MRNEGMEFETSKHSLKVDDLISVVLELLWNWTIVGGVAPNGVEGEPADMLRSRAIVIQARFETTAMAISRSLLHSCLSGSPDQLQKDFLVVDVESTP